MFFIYSLKKLFISANLKQALCIICELKFYKSQYTGKFCDSAKLQKTQQPEF